MLSPIYLIMRIHKIGRLSYNNGKRLLDILQCLKSFGINRVVHRQHVKTKYAEPSYFIIKEVKPYMADPTAKLKEDIHTTVKAQKVFRGQDYGLAKIDSHYKDDWRLVPKNEEYLWLSHEVKSRDKKDAPMTIELPPLLKYWFRKQMPEGAPLPEIRAVYSKSKNNVYNLNDENGR